MTQNNLSYALLALAERLNDTALLKEAAAICHAALEVFNDEGSRSGIAIAQSNLDGILKRLLAASDTSPGRADDLD